MKHKGGLGGLVKYKGGLPKKGGAWTVYRFKRVLGEKEEMLFLSDTPVHVMNSSHIITELTIFFMLSGTCTFEIRSSCLEVSVTRNKNYKGLILLHKQVIFVSSK